MALADLPCVPDSGLPAELAAQLPASTPPAPWSCRVGAVIWLQRAPSPLAAGSPFAGRARGQVLWAVVDYLDSPVGPYREVLVGQRLRSPGPGGLGLPVLHVPFIAVDSLASVHGGRTHWDLPKAVAAFHGDLPAPTVTGDGWTVSVRATSRGPRLPVVGPLRTDQGRGVATTRLRGTARLARVEVSATGPVLSGWLGTGTHPGLVAEGRMVVGPPE
jgi:hypothetical protein